MMGGYVSFQKGNCLICILATPKIDFFAPKGDQVPCQIKKYCNDLETSLWSFEMR